MIVHPGGSGRTIHRPEHWWWPASLPFQWLEGRESSGQRSIKESFACEMALPPMGETGYEMMQAVYRAREVAPVPRDESLQSLRAIGRDLPALSAVLVADALAAGETITHAMIPRWSRICRAAH